MIEKFITVSANKNIQPLHWHTTLELNLVLRGNAIGILNNVKEQLREGGIWVINRDVAHCITQTSDDFLYVQLHLNTEFFNSYIPDIWTVYFKCGASENDAASESLKSEIRAQIHTIVNLMESQVTETQRENAILYAGIEILTTLKLGFNMIGKKLQSERDNEQFNRIWRIIDYIYDHCNRRLTLKEVAAQEYLSEPYLSKLMKEQTGETFEASLAHIRAECSIKYLLETEMSVTDIAYECGFSAPRYYNAAFEKHYHCTPTKYRQKNKDFILQEDEVTASSVIFQEEIDREEVLQLLKTYYRDTSLPWEVNRFQLNFDHFMEKSLKGERLVRKNTLLCTARDILLHEKKKLVLRCKNELNLKSVALADMGSKAMTEIIESNLVQMGLALTNDKENSLDFKHLFLDGGVCTNEFYAQKILNCIEEPYLFMRNSLILYCAQKDVKLVLFNSDKEKEKKFVINFAGEKAKKSYLLKKEYVPFFSKEKTEIIRYLEKQSDHTWLKEMMTPEKHIAATDALEKLTLEESLECGQVCRITMREINK